MARRAWHPSSDTRNEILDEVERQLFANGMNATTVGSVAKQLGMSPSNIFKNFGSKAGLIDALVERELMRIDAAFECEAHSDSAADNLRTLARFFLGSHLRHKLSNPHVDVLISIAFETPKCVLAFKSQILKRIENIIAEGIKNGEFPQRDVVISSETVLDALTLIMDPLQLMKPANTENLDNLRARADRLIEFVIGGLRMPLVR